MSAWTVIAHTEVGSGGIYPIEFTSISGSYTDLVLLFSSRDERAAAANEIRLYFNGSNANLSARNLEGVGSGSGTSASFALGFAGVGNSDTSTASTFSSVQIYIPNYAGNTNKSYSVDSVSEQNGTTAYQEIVAGLWSSTAAITSITLINGTGADFAQYTSATLYGVLKGSSGGVTVS